MRSALVPPDGDPREDGRPLGRRGAATSSLAAPRTLPCHRADVRRATAAGARALHPSMRSSPSPWPPFRPPVDTSVRKHTIREQRRVRRPFGAVADPESRLSKAAYGLLQARWEPESGRPTVTSPSRDRCLLIDGDLLHGSAWPCAPSGGPVHGPAVRSGAGPAPPRGSAIEEYFSNGPVGIDWTG